MTVFVCLFTFSYPEAGTYPITVTALSKYFHTNLSINSSIEVFERIRNLTLWQIKEGQVIRLSKDLQGHFSHQPLRIRANVSSGTSVTFNFSKPGTLISWFEASFKFDSGGDREITVTALNKISQLNKTLRVIVVEECGSQMSILDKRAEGEPLRTTRGYELKFSVEEIRLKNYSACNQPASCNWTFFWELSKKVLSEYKLDKMYNNSPVFFIEKGTLDVGLYKVVLKAFCNDSERSNKSSFSQTYFKIELTKPVALISGGYRRDVAYIENGEFTLDASSSYDPDIKYFNSTGLTFFWTSNASLEIQKNESSSIKVSMRRLQVKDVIAFKVTVIKSGNINDMAKQVIHIIEENVPTTEIK